VSGVQDDVGVRAVEDHVADPDRGQLSEAQAGQNEHLVDERALAAEDLQPGHGFRAQARSWLILSPAAIEQPRLGKRAALGSI